MNSDPEPGAGPLNRDQIEWIESTLLPALDRHHLRLQAHCLATFQHIAHPLTQGQLPGRDRWLEWCERQPQLANDPEFTEQLMMQFTVIATQLDALAKQCGISPLELTLSDLIEHTERRSRDRLAQSG